MVGGEVRKSGGHDHANGAEDDTVVCSARFVALPSSEEGRLVDVTIDPVAILEVIVHEAIDGGYVGEFGDQVAVLFEARTTLE